jgi:hypothetical protein
MTNQTDFFIDSDDLHELLIDDAHAHDSGFWVELNDDDQDGIIIERTDILGFKSTTYLYWLHEQTYVVDDTTSSKWERREQISVNNILDWLFDYHGRA